MYRFLLIITSFFLISAVGYSQNATYRKVSLDTLQSRVSKLYIKATGDCTTINSNVHIMKRAKIANALGINCIPSYPYVLDVKSKDRDSIPVRIMTRATYTGDSAFRSAIYVTDQAGTEMASLKFGRYNIGIGRQVFNTTTRENILGTRPAYNIAIGYQALKAITIGQSNIAIGYNVASALTTQSYNVLINGNVLGNGNIVIGTRTGIGNYNTVIGYGSSNTALDSDYHIFIGNDAGTKKYYGNGFLAINNQIGGRDTALLWGYMGDPGLGYPLLVNRYLDVNAKLHAKDSFDVAGKSRFHYPAYFGVTQPVASSSAVVISQGDYDQYGLEIVNNDVANYKTPQIYLGGPWIYSTYGVSQSNLFFGYQTGNAYINRGKFLGTAPYTAKYNLAIGNGSLYADTSGKYNTCLGHYSGYSNITGDSNTYIGGWAGYWGTTAKRNTIIGFDAGIGNSTSKFTGSDNVIVGARSGNEITTASRNVIVGYGAAEEFVEAYENVSIGDSSMSYPGYYPIHPRYNVGVGTKSLFKVGTSDYCIGIGHGAGYNTSENGELFIGIGGSSSDSTNTVIYSKMLDTPNPWLRLNADVYVKNSLKIGSITSDTLPVSLLTQSSGLVKKYSPDSSLFGYNYWKKLGSTNNYLQPLDSLDVAMTKGFYHNGGSGDVNTSGKLTSADALFIILHLMNITPFTTLRQFINADADGDGLITISDALFIQRCIVGSYPGSGGLITSTPRNEYKRLSGMMQFIDPYLKKMAFGYVDTAQLIYKYDLQINSLEDSVNVNAHFRAKKTVRIDSVAVDPNPDTLLTYSGDIVKKATVASGVFSLDTSDIAFLSQENHFARDNYFEDTLYLGPFGGVKMYDGGEGILMVENGVQVEETMMTKHSIISPRYLLSDYTEKNYPLTVYASGTPDTITTSYAAMNFGTTDPVLTIDRAGTYLITTRFVIDAVGVGVNVYPQADSIYCKLYRTNNTPGDISNTETYQVQTISDVITQTYPLSGCPQVIYTTANTNDQLTLYTKNMITLISGSIVVREASIVAVRLY